ncbi:GMC family oxidoreductase [Pseudorhodoferax sp. Leaf265]|uniref:GMC family oxidoreductase n=1 Tax=Pseudorhodoferax sp. Leaf265 TaxID=1736315 RepID=UPI0007C81555|nr:GMC family oxidoreductase [Pseudorhodoferax sp. Leaf265]
MRSNPHRNTRTEVLIIGAGMAGGAIAKRISDHGIQVICLEQGPEIQQSQLPHLSESFELDKTRDANVHPNVRGLKEDYPVTSDDIGSSIRMVNAVGGSANKYSGVWMRPRPSDFRKGTEHGMAPDWPISYEDLAPYFDICDAEMGISGLNGDPGYPARAPRSTPMIPLGRGGQRLASTLDKLGWHWWPTDNAILTEDMDGRLACNHCGQCVMGCPRGSMGTSATAFWPQAIRNGVDLRTFARVHRIVYDGQRATGAVYEDLNTGTQHEVSADIVIVCANGIGTTRLLLMSGSGATADGLANSSGLLGKNLMLHPQGFVEGIFDDPMDSYKGARGSPLYCGEFMETDPSRGFVNGYTIVMVRAPGAGYASMGYSTFKPVHWGADHHRHFGEMFNRQLWLMNLAEDLPMERNTVTLDPHKKDSSGLPAPKVAYRMHDQDRRATQHAIDRSQELMWAAGARIVNNSGVLEQPCGFHLMGTARMGFDRTDSVVNKWHRSWDIPNLFVCDGSSMASSFGVTPTATIGAMAVRLADYIARNKGTLLQRTATEEAAIA